MLDSASKNDHTIGQKLLEGLDFELRTLLNGFVGPMQFLKYKIDDHGLVDIFRMLDSSLSRLERLSNRAAIVNSIDSKSANFECKSINLVDLVRFSILELQPIADIENIKLAVQDEQDEISVFGDYNLLLQAFQVLLELAISLSVGDSSIDISFSSTQNQVLCFISTSSVDFPVELSTHPVDESTLTDPSWDISMAKKKLHHHNAILQVNCEESRNSTICILFERIFA